MKRIITCAILLGMLFCSVSLASEPVTDKNQENALLAFLENTYEAIGKYPENGKIYRGTVRLTRKGQSLIMQRDIQGTKISGKARIVAATADAVPVLQANFTEGKKNYQITYVIGSDLDNYARLSGRVYFADKETKKPGMEALFIQLQPEK